MTAQGLMLMFQALIFYIYFFVLNISFVIRDRVQKVTLTEREDSFLEYIKVNLLLQILAIKI